MSPSTKLNPLAHSPAKVLVTGGTGFIGAALVRTLVAAGDEVHVVTRSGVASRLTDVAGRYQIHRGDLRDFDFVSATMRKVSPEIIFHLAAEGVALGSTGLRRQLLQDNVAVTSNLLEALAGTPYRAFVHAGSGAEYGVGRQAFIEDSPLRPVSDYGVAKAACSLLCQLEARRGRPVVIVRIFGAYGPGEGPQRLIPYLMRCCLNGEPAHVSTGTQLRDWIFIDDVVGLLRAAADRPTAAGQVLHAATGIAQSVRDAIELVFTVSGRRTQVVYGIRQPSAAQPDRYLASIDRTQELTSWRPESTLREGISRSWDWFWAIAKSIPAERQAG